MLALTALPSPSIKPGERVITHFQLDPAHNHVAQETRTATTRPRPYLVKLLAPVDITWCEGREQHFGFLDLYNPGRPPKLNRDVGALVEYDML
jgi:hypothetical protein